MSSIQWLIMHIWPQKFRWFLTIWANCSSKVKLIIESTFTEDGGFIPTLFDTFDLKLTVVKSARNMRDAGCIIKWEFTYDGANGNASLSNLKNIMSQAFKDLDTYLRNHRGVRRPWSPSSYHRSRLVQSRYPYYTIIK